MRADSTITSNVRAYGVAAIFIAAVLLPAHLDAQTFQKTFGTQREERAEWVQQTNDGGYVICGWRGADSADPHVYVLKLDAAGALQWDTQLNGAGIDVPTRILEVADGYVLAGETNGNAVGFGISLLKLDLAGNLLWSFAYPGTPFAGGSHNQTWLELAGSADGGFILCGRLQGIQGIAQAPVLLRTDANGTLLWMKYYVDIRFNADTFASFADVHPYMDAAGQVGFLACGFTAQNVFGSRDSLLVATDSLGNVLWSKLYADTGHTDFALGLDVAANNDILMSGFTKWIGEGGGTYLLRTNPVGSLLWLKTFRFFGSTNSMLETPSGDIVLAGNANDFANFNDPAIMLTDSAGGFLWGMRYGGANQEFGECVVPTFDGGYKLAAWTNSFGAGSFDIYSIKTDALGMSGCNENAFQPLLGSASFETDITVRGLPLEGQVQDPMEPLPPNTIQEDLCNPPCVDPPANMVAWWPLDELDETLPIVDLINGNDGFTVNSPLGQPGEYVDNSWCFNGINTYIEVPDAPELNFGQGDFSIDAWVRTADVAGVKIIIDKRSQTAAGTTGYSLFMASGQLGFQVADGSGSNVCNSCPTGASCTNYFSGVNIATGLWTHVAVTVRRAAVGGGTFYVNGAPVATFDPSCHPGSVTNSGPLRIGARSLSLSGVLRGCVDEVELFNRELDASEVFGIYNAGQSGKCKPNCVDPPADMTAWWPLDDPAGQPFMDELVHDNDGVAFGPTALIGEWVDNSRCFDGLNDYIEVADAPALDFGVGNFSIDAWIRTVDTGTVRIIVDKRFQDAGGTIGYSLFTSAGNLGFQLADGGGSNVCGFCPTGASCTNYISGTNVATGNWVHVAVTINRFSDVGTFYVDGAPVGTFDISCHPGSVSNTSPLRIGSRSLSVSAVFRGCIDEVELFRRALSPDEIAALFAAGDGGKCKPRCHCLGDLNGDCVVDLTDLAVMLGNFGTVGGAQASDGDLDGDGDVDLSDLAAILGVFGQPCP